MKNKLYKLAIILILASLFLFISITNIKAKSGCCSWHKGVCGCDTNVGRQVCCNGTYSPSCGCIYIPTVRKPTPIPTRKPTPTKKPTLRPTKKDGEKSMTVVYDQYGQGSCIDPSFLRPNQPLPYGSVGALGGGVSTSKAAESSQDNFLVGPSTDGFQIDVSQQPYNSIIGWLILIALVGGGYYLYKKAEK